MSKPSTPSSSNPSHCSFGLIRAILIGAGLGFITVLLVPYFVPLPSVKYETQSFGKDGKLFPVKPADSGVSDSAFAEPRTEFSSEDHFPDKVSPDSEKPLVSEIQKLPGNATPEIEPNTDDAEKHPNGPQAGNADADAVPTKTDEDSKIKAEPVLVPAVQLAFPKAFPNRDMTEGLEPLLSFKVSEGDASSIKEAIAAASKDKDDAAKAAVATIASSAGRKLVRWKQLSSENAPLKEVLAFHTANPRFPAQALAPESERKLLLSDSPANEVLKFFANRKPLSAAGRACLGGALIDKGERDRGISLIRQAWTHCSLDPAVQDRIESRFHNVLSEEDRNLRSVWVGLKARKTVASEDKANSSGLKAVARLRGKHGKGHALHVGKHSRNTRRNISRGGTRQHFHHRLGRRHAVASSGASENDEAQATSALKAPHSLTEFIAFRKRHQKRALERKAKQKEASKSKGDEKKTSKTDDSEPSKTSQSKAAGNALKLTKEVNASPASLLTKLKGLRKTGRNERLWSILRSLKPTDADLADPERWWDLRRTEARRALNEGMDGTAYAIAKAHGPLDDETTSEAEFLAGWIALRTLKDPEKAQVHFVAARQAKGSARDEARALYWLARTKKELGARSEAEALFAEAATRFYTYYGQLARESLRKRSDCEFRSPILPTKEYTTAFTNEDAYKAVLIIKQLDMKQLLISYILDLARQIDDPQEMTLLMELTERVAPHQLAVRAAKIALLRGFPVEAYAFPALLPKFRSAGENDKVELPLLNALTRQESEFNSGSTSSVGARGLMQLMPQTARLMASAYKLKYEQPRLVSDPSYNVTLGSAFLASLISGYDGSYILSLAAYNAGPGRIASWIKQFGDPRKKGVDPIDWVERIPFNETREYVERILEGTQLYRCRFENGKARPQLLHDLHRGRPGKVPDFGELEGIAEPGDSQ